MKDKINDLDLKKLKQMDAIESYNNDYLNDLDLQIHNLIGMFQVPESDLNMPEIYEKMEYIQNHCRNINVSSLSENDKTILNELKLKIEYLENQVYG